MDAAMPPIVTEGLTKPDPKIETVVPVTPREGEKLVMVGGPARVKFAALVTVPDGVETLIFPVDALAGTVVVICVAEFIVKPALTPLKVTEFVPTNPDPVITTLDPAGPLAGVKFPNCGMTEKLAELKPVAVVVSTEI